MYGMNVGPSPGSVVPSIVRMFALIVGDGIWVTLATARTMLAENIRRDRNRASIALWSVANETPVGPERNAFLSALIAEGRRLDDTRLMTAALLTRREDRNGHTEMIVDDPLIANLDVMAANTYNGWYSEDELSKLPSFTWTSSANKPLIFS